MKLISISPFWASSLWSWNFLDEYFSACCWFLPHLWVNIRVHVFGIHWFCLVKYFEWRSMVSIIVLFFFQHRYWRNFDKWWSKNLSFNHCRNSSFVRPQTNFFTITFTDIWESVKLGNMYFFNCIDFEVFISYNDLVSPVIYFFLLLSSHFFDHVISRYEHCVEIFFMWKCWSLCFYFTHEIWFSILTNNELESFHSIFSFFSLEMVRNFKSIDCGLSWSLWMFIPVFSLHDIVKSTSCLPASLIFFLLFDCNLILIHQWESKAQMFSWISIKLSWIFDNLLS